MLEEEFKPITKETSFHLSEIQPYLSDIGLYIQGLDDIYNANLLTKLFTKS
jgi:hypothetical protein